MFGQRGSLGVTVSGDMDWGLQISGISSLSGLGTQFPLQGLGFWAWILRLRVLWVCVLGFGAGGVGGVPGPCSRLGAARSSHSAQCC